MLRLIRRSMLVIALAGLSAGVSGCLALAVPSLAYQGYKYEHPDKTKTANKQQESTSQKKPTTPSGQSIPQNEIE